MICIVDDFYCCVVVVVVAALAVDVAVIGGVHVFGKWVFINPVQIKVYNIKLKERT